MDSSNPFSSLAPDNEDSDAEEPQNFYLSANNRQDETHPIPSHSAYQTRGQHSTPLAAVGNVRFGRAASTVAISAQSRGGETSTVNRGRGAWTSYRGRGAVKSNRGGYATNGPREVASGSLQQRAPSSPQRGGVPVSRAHGESRGRGSPSRRRPNPNAPPNVFGEAYATTRPNFPRVVPLNIPINTQKEDQRLFKQQADHSVIYLRQKPEDEDLLAITGIFLWPSEEIGAESIRTEDPRLDEIRKRYQCHMVMTANPKRLCVYGTDVETAESVVSGALDAVRTLMHESLHRTSRCVRFILANPAVTIEWPPDIRMVSPQTPGIASSRAAKVEEFKGRIAMVESPMVAYQTNFVDASYISRKNTLTLEMALAKGLDRLLLSPGRVEVKALIGCFVFNRMANPPKGQETTPISLFLEKLRDTKSQGVLLRLSPEADLFGRALARTDLLTAFHEGKPCALEKVKPTYVGVFTFGTQGTQDVVDRQFTLETEERCNEGEVLSVARRVWTSPYEHPSSRRLEAYVANLEGGLSWKLEAVAQPYCRNIGDELQRFQANVALKEVTAASNAPGSTELMFKVPWSQSRKDFYQRTQWKFFAKKNQNYTFQISRLDRFKLPAVAGGVKLSEAEQRRPVETEWEACVYDERWDEALGQNATLNLGESAGWDPSIASFFPSTGDGHQESENGFAEFVKCVNEVCCGLSEAKSW